MCKPIIISLNFAEGEHVLAYTTCFFHSPADFSQYFNILSFLQLNIGQAWDTSSAHTETMHSLPTVSPSQSDCTRNGKRNWLYIFLVGLSGVKEPNFPVAGFCPGDTVYSAGREPAGFWLISCRKLQPTLCLDRSTPKGKLKAIWMAFGRLRLIQKVWITQHH